MGIFHEARYQIFGCEKFRDSDCQKQFAPVKNPNVFIGNQLRKNY
jgi:hypothetical protein